MLLEAYNNSSVIDLDSPAVLFQQGGHSVFWLGINEDTISGVIPTSS